MIQINFFGDFVVSNVEKISLQDNLSKIIVDADYNCLNFEAPLAGFPHDSIEKSGPSIFMDSNSIDFLRKYNFNIVSLANNHIMDKGLTGLRETIGKLENQYLGAGEGLDAYKPKIINNGGIRMAFMALTHKEFGCVENEEDFGAAWMCHPNIFNMINQIKQNVDFLFFIVHAGVEYLDVPLPEIRNLYKSYITSGVDAVIASHPHVPQGYEVYKGKPIFYSLGNFCFQNEALPYNNDKPYWNDSLGVSFFIESSTAISYTVYNLYYSQLDGEISINKNADIQKHIVNCNELLKDDIVYRTFLDNSLRDLLPYYMSMFNGAGWYQNKINKSSIKALLNILLRKPSNYRHLLNLLQCESHRWIVMRMLQKNIL